MTKRKVFFFFMVCFAGTMFVSAQDAGKVSIEPYKFRTYDGREHAAELGKLAVTENRKTKSSRVIQLTFVRLRSRASKPNFPIVFLAGFPGIPGIGLGQVPVYFNLFEKLRDVSDVILLDQRGTGMSSPNLQCPPAAFPVDVFASTDKLMNSYAEFVKTCVKHWREQGVDLGGYNSNQSADDLEDLRLALRSERLNLLAWSYGSELALATIRRYGNRVDQMVLAGSRGPDHLVKLPSVWDSQLKSISALASTDPSVNRSIPDMETLTKRVFNKLDENPVTVTVFDRRANRPVNLLVGKIGLQTLIRGDLSDPRAFSSLPALVHTIDQGDYSIFTKRMEQLYNGFGGSAMALATDCSAGWSNRRLEQAQKESGRALMNNVNLQWRPDICGLTGNANLGSAFRSKIRSNVRTLFISGSLDPNAPPSQTEDIKRGFKNGVHLIIENGGHEMFPAPDVHSVIVDFFKGQNVSGRVLAFPTPRFTPVDEAKEPQAPRSAI